MLNTLNNNFICVLVTILLQTRLLFCWDTFKECREFSKLVSDRIQIMPLLPRVYPFRIEQKICNRANSLIVGGHNAVHGEFPHMTAIGYKRDEHVEWLCGGSLISRNYILTAAHCAHTKWGIPDVVRLGSLSVDNHPDTDINVEKAIVHPGYNPPKVYNDVALLKLSENISFNRFLHPACLSPVRNLSSLPNNVLTATGWGRTIFGGPTSSKLLKVALEIVENEECEKHFPYEQQLPNGVDDSMFCAVGHSHRFHDTCQGDSGGPLQTTIRGNECMQQIIGITSVGKHCGSGSPAIYMKVSTFVPWIESTLSENNS